MLSAGKRCEEGCGQGGGGQVLLLWRQRTAPRPGSAVAAASKICAAAIAASLESISAPPAARDSEPTGLRVRRRCWARPRRSDPSEAACPRARVLRRRRKGRCGQADGSPRSEMAARPVLGAPGGALVSGPAPREDKGSEASAAVARTHGPPPPRPRQFTLFDSDIVGCVMRSRIAGQRGCYDGMLMSSLDTIPKRACMDTVLVIDCTGATCTVCELQTYENEWHGMNTGTEACPFAGCGLASSSRFCRRLRSVLSVQRHSCADDSEENRPARTRLARKDRPAPRLPRRTAPRLAAPRRASSRLLAQALHRGASLRRAPGPQCSLTRRPAGPVTRPMPVYRGPGPMP